LRKVKKQKGTIKNSVALVAMSSGIFYAGGEEIGDMGRL
jgi:hypothetical protein